MSTPIESADVATMRIALKQRTQMAASQPR